MSRVYKYKKFTDKYTTYTAIDNGEEDKKITELCTINNETYISIPNDVVLPEQPKEITLEPVVITTELKGQIEKESPHIRLIEKRIIAKVREKYPIEAQLKIIRDKINGINIEKYAEYNSYVEDCVADGEIKKELLMKTADIKSK